MPLYCKGAIRGVSFLYIRRTFKVQLIHCVWLMLTQLCTFKQQPLFFSRRPFLVILKCFFYPQRIPTWPHAFCCLHDRAFACAELSRGRAVFTLASFLTRLNGANATGGANENAKMRRRSVKWSPPSPLWNCLCCKCVSPPLPLFPVKPARSER